MKRDISRYRQSRSCPDIKKQHSSDPCAMSPLAPTFCPEIREVMDIRQAPTTLGSRPTPLQSLRRLCAGVQLGNRGASAFAPGRWMDASPTSRLPKSTRPEEAGSSGDVNGLKCVVFQAEIEANWAICVFLAILPQNGQNRAFRAVFIAVTNCYK